MGDGGSAELPGTRRSPWAGALAPLAVLAGVAAMMATATLLRPLARLRLSLLAAEVALALPALIALMTRARPLVGLRPVPPLTAALAVCSGLALWAASLGLLELQYSIWPPPRGYLDDFHGLHRKLRPQGPADALLSLSAIALAPAACEEILFRGLALGALAVAVGGGPAVVISALLFGLIHVDVTAGGATLYRVPFAIGVGLLLGLLRVRTRSVLPAMLAHAVLNALTFMAAMNVAAPEGAPAPRPLMGASLFIAGLAAQAWLWRRIPRAILDPPRKEPS